MDFRNKAFSTIFYTVVLISLVQISCNGKTKSNTVQVQPSNLSVDGASQRNELRASNSVLVSECANLLPNPSYFNVNYRVRHLCSLPNNYAEYWVRYKIVQNDNRIALHLKLAVDFLPTTTSSQTKSEMLQKVRSCIPAVKQVFKRYDLNLNLDIDPITGHETNFHDQHINIHNGSGRSNMFNWYLQILSYENPTLCSMITHEIGHYLSLDDEYSDEQCPNRIFISRESNPISVMRDGSFDLDYIDFYPRHLSNILNMACPEIMH